MMVNISFPDIRDFIRRERLYVLLLIFIISINAALMLTGSKGQVEPQPSKITRILEQKNSLSQEELSRLLLEDRRLRIFTAIFSLTILFALIAGLFLDLVILILKKEGGVLIFPTTLQKTPLWGIWDVCKVVILMLFFGHSIVLIELGLSKAFPILKISHNLVSILNATITDTFLFIFIIYFAVRIYGHRLISLGLSAKNFIKNCFYGIAGYLAAIPALILALILIMWLVTLFKYEPPIQPVLEIFFEEEKRSIILYLGFFVAVAGPIVEELFFRGFLYQAIKKRYGIFNALIFSSALFALLHANLTGFLPIMILGMLLAYLFEKTGTLIAPICVHILHNSVMVWFTIAAKEVYGKLGFF